MMGKGQIRSPMGYMLAGEIESSIFNREPKGETDNQSIYDGKLVSSVKHRKNQGPPCHIEGLVVDEKQISGG
jgi:hypothetical protein